ncbi:MAG: mechanosensitive ion channel [Proteobacteria bacterium]|nr:mechanosensitive ion channel [Pseudomonadota bacterium]
MNPIKTSGPRYRPLKFVVVLLAPVLALWLVLPGALAAKQDTLPTTPQETTVEISPDSIALRIKEVKKSLTDAQAGENERNARKLGLTLSQLQDRTAKFRELEAVYQRLVTALKKKSSSEKEESFWQEKLSSRQQIELSREPPYSLSFYDNTLDQLSTAEYRQETANLAASLAVKALEDSRSRLDERQQILRRFKEKQALNGTGVAPAEQNREFAQAQLDLEIARAIFDLQRVAKQNLTIEVRLAALSADIARQNMVWVQKHLFFDKADLEKQIGLIARTRAELQQRLKNQLREQMGVEAEWLQVQKRMADAQKETDIALSRAALEATDAKRATSQRLLEQTEDMLQLLNQQEQAWKNRYALVQGEKDPEQLDNWRKVFENYTVNIERSLRLLESYQTSLQAQITALSKQLSEQGSKLKLRHEMENRLYALHNLADGSQEYLTTLRATVQLHQRLLEEIAAKREQFSMWKEFTALSDKVQGVWNLELWVIDEHGVTVKKAATALFFLIIGLVFIKKIILLMTRRFLSRIQMKETTAAAVQKMVNYIAILLIVLFALRVVNIPLTLFTFLGGAVAIGFGFGAQNLINNFISGFIIMAERPIKIGDLIETDGTFAVVEEIGARCTRIRTGANVHILVPNSSFLEKNIINWTLSDQEVRAQVTVGVIYGSPVREVERIMLQVAAENKRVNKEPEPFVLFNDFGDNALIFDLYFWISMNRLMDRRIIESDIRFRIDELFRPVGIVIAFPQRDVHLDTQRPLELRIINAEDRSGKIEKE